MTLDESIQGMRLRVMKRAAAVGVSTACREAGSSRTLFYRWQRRLSRYGVDGLHPRRLRARPGPAPQLAPAVERRLLAVAIAEATWGAARLASYAQRLWRLRVAASTVQRLLRRHGLATRRQRLLVLEHHSATQAGLLTERTRQALWRLRHGRTRHVAAERPGELVCLDTFYIGHLRGSRQGVADHRVLRGEFVRGGAHPAGALASGHRRLSAPRPGACGPACR